MRTRIPWPFVLMLTGFVLALMHNTPLFVLGGVLMFIGIFLPLRSLVDRNKQDTAVFVAVIGVAMMVTNNLPIQLVGLVLFISGFGYVAFLAK